MTALQYLDMPDGERVAYHQTHGEGPGLIWCGGLKSDMEGGKATFLHDWCKSQGRAFLRFDYFGHGQSSGAFTAGCISRWASDTRYVLETLTKGPQILVGSSMGGWASLMTAMARPDLVAGLLLIAPAPDFTEKLMWPRFTPEIQKEILQNGIYYEPSDYGDPMELTLKLIEDGRENLIMDAPIDFFGPVHILQGMRDDPVPWQHAQKLLTLIQSEHMELTLVKDGDHSLSRPEDLTRLKDSAARLIARLDAGHAGRHAHGHSDE